MRRVTKNIFTASSNHCGLLSSMGGLSLNSSLLLLNLLIKRALDVIDQRLNLLFAITATAILLLLLVSIGGFFPAVHVILKFAFKGYSICLIFDFDLVRS